MIRTIITVSLALASAINVLAQSVKLNSGDVVCDGAPVLIQWDYKDAPPGTTVGIEVMGIVDGGGYGFPLTQGSRNPSSGQMLWTPLALNQSGQKYALQVTWYSNVPEYVGNGYTLYETITNVTTKTVTVLSRPRSLKLTLPSSTSVTRGQSTWITWQSKGLPSGANIQLWLQPQSNSEAGGLPVTVSSDTGGYFWTVPLNFPPGQYYVQAFWVTEYGVYGTQDSDPGVPIYIQ